MPETDISIVVATRNRAKALEMSLPLMLSQTLPPREIFVVDSSDDPSATKALIDRLARTTDVPIEWVPSAPGLTVQRNVGLARVSAPVVAFPDDDSLLYPTYLEEIARVYSADADEVLVGVTVLAASRSPLKTGRADKQGPLPVETYAAKNSGRVKRRLGKWYLGLERRLAPIPYSYLRQDILRGRALPQAVKALDCSAVPAQEGFRMSFRTRHLRRSPFNEHLSGYSLGEDIDVCYGLASLGMIARLNKELIFHHEFPGARADGRRWGVMQPLNIAYIVARHTDPGHAARQAVTPWVRSLVLQAILRSASAYQRHRLRGLFAARQQLDRLLSAPRADVDRLYLAIASELVT